VNDEEVRPDGVLLDRLVDCAEDAGERTSRKEVIASLILDAELDGPGLAARIRRLRLATVGDVVAQVSRHEALATNAPRRPGPRARLERGATREGPPPTASITSPEPADAQG
jgi:hypothetical protein